MNEANAKLVRYFITFSLGFTTGTFISQIFINGFVKTTAIISFVLIAVSTVLFIFRAYEDDGTKALRMFKKCADLVEKHQTKTEEKL